MRTKIRSRKNIFSKDAHLLKNKKYSKTVLCLKRYSSNLEQGGLEIPAKMIFQTSNETIIEEMKKKLAPLIEEYN